MTKQLIQLFCACICTLFLASCNSSNEETSTETRVANDGAVEGAPFTRSFEMDTCLLISHKVENFDVWKAAFDLSEDARIEHGIKTMHVYQGKEDKNWAMVLASIEDVDKAKAYVTSDHLESSMRLAGVEGDMDLDWIKQRLEYTDDASDTLLMYMNFKVINYDRWENAFLDDYRGDEAHEFEVTDVLQGVDDQGEVTMLFKVNEPDYIQKMESNNSFRMKMLAAGVVSYPETHKLVEQEI